MQLKTSCTENISTITLSTSNRTSNLKKFVALPTTQSYTTKLTQASNGQTTHYQPLSHPTLVEPEPAHQDIAGEYEAAERYWLA